MLQFVTGANRRGWTGHSLQWLPPLSMSLDTNGTPCPQKPPLGLRPRWLVLELRADEIKSAMQRYKAQGLPCPRSWLIELRDIERQLTPPLLADLTLGECCERWGVNSRNAIKARAAALGVELRRESSTRTVWPSEHLPLGDALAEHLKQPKGTLANFGRSVTPQKGRLTEVALRRFASISRTILSDGDHVIDAIDDEGTAWFMLPDKQIKWRRMPPLPASWGGDQQ